MPRTMVGLLAAVGAAMAAIVSLAHGDLAGPTIAAVGTVTGTAAFLASPPPKNLGESESTDKVIWSKQPHAPACAR